MQLDAIDIYNKLSQFDKKIGDFNTKDISIGSGAAGISLFYYQLYSLTKNDKFLKKAQSFIRRCVKDLDSVNEYSMLDGYFGIVWAIDLLFEKKAIGLNERTFFSALDSQLYIISLRSLMRGEYDYWNGGLGAVLHALKRVPDLKATGYLNQMLSIFNSSNILDLYLKQLEYKLNQKVKFLSLNGQVEIFSALTDIISILIKVYSKECLNIKVSSQIAERLTLIISYIEIAKKRQQLFFDQHMNWSFSTYQLVFATVLCNAEKLYNLNEFKLAAIRIIESIINEEETNYSKEALPILSLVGGASGRALLYKTLYQKTEISSCLKRYEFWIRMTVERLNVTTLATPGLFSGMSGIGIILTDYLNSGNENEWKECFLIDP